MKKIDNKKIKKKAEDYVAVLLERVHSDIKLIAEGQIGVQRQLDEFKDEMHSFKDEMLEFKQDTKSGFRQIFEYLSRIEDEIMEIKEDLRDNYERKGWDKKWREAIEKRLEKIEKSLVDKKMIADIAV